MFVHAVVQRTAEDRAKGSAVERAVEANLFNVEEDLPGLLEKFLRDESEACSWSFLMKSM